jgi:phospholipid-binding lipoprotein MlaA
VRAVVVSLLCSAVVLSGCVTAQRPDPLEPLNRKVFAFNDAVDTAVLKPVAQVYKVVLPSPVQLAVSNFFGNVKDAWSAVNLFLQGRFADGFSDVMRFGTNTVFGFAGVMDIATELGFERHGEDFGQTLGRWGVPSGAYIVWPILGPSTVRDSIGLPVDMMATPESLVSVSLTRKTMTGLRLVSARAGVLSATGLIDDIALDKYAFVRNAYLQRRRSLVYDGNPPDEEEPDEMSAPLDKSR